MSSLADDVHVPGRIPKDVPPVAAGLDDPPLQRRSELLWDLAKALSWNGRANSLEVADAAYQGRLSIWLETVLALPFEQKLPGPFATLLRKLPLLLDIEERRNFLRIPRVQQLALRAPDALTPYEFGKLLKLLHSFCVSVGKFAPHDEGIWAPLGDRFIAPGTIAGGSPEPCFPVIDTESPFAIPLIPDLKSGYASDRTRARDSAEHLCRALDFIADRLPEAISFIRKNVEVFVLRFGESANENGLSSGSCHEWLGAIFLINGDAGPQIVERLAEAAVHEAIHTQIYKVEEITERLPQNGRFIVSPWSGNKIACANYIHACLVWYGLFHFWKRIVSSEHRAAVYVRYLQRAERGFLSRQVASNQNQLRSFVDPLIVDLILSLEDEVAGCATNAAVA